METDRTPPPSDDDQLVKNSALYRQFLAEREEILRHKWIKSEQAGKDVGFENALLDWMLKHRTDWHEHRAESESAERLVG
ncbi:hypothetical protein BH23VER1_BH23VER1_30040 [soil metagenome]